MDTADLFREAFHLGASDLFLTAGRHPAMRVSGQVVFREDLPVTAAAELEDLRRSLLTAGRAGEASAATSGDAAWDLPGECRFRINFFSAGGVPALAARPLRSGDELRAEDLNLPESVAVFAGARRGLILITGAAGSGKSTTLSVIINLINSSRRGHIVTIEDPVEYIHGDRMCLVAQREVGTDTPDFDSALRDVVRQSPDVIVIGEMRDMETMQTALSAALTGHLVITTLHTANTIQAAERIVNSFPEHLRDQVAGDLAMALVGILSQRLLPDTSGGMIPAVETLTATPAVRKFMADRDFPGLENLLRQSRLPALQSFSRSLQSLVETGRVSREDALAAADAPDELDQLLRGMESGVDTFRGLPDWENDSEEVNMKRLLRSAVKNQASDLILSAGTPPTLRIAGALCPLNTAPLSGHDTRRLLFSVLNTRQQAEFEENREIDLALSVRLRRSAGEKEPGEYRFRVNGFYQRGFVGGAVRIIPDVIPSCEELHLPVPLVELTAKKQGFVLVTGPTGHGKSTTLASLIDRINRDTPCHIVTVEDPIEYVHHNRAAIVEQREVHSDTASFQNALKFVLRQDPDVILIGEMRDAETMAAALTAAETGHLVFATLHTNSAAQSIDRIIDSFPAHQQNQIRIQLAATLLAVVSQRLIPKSDGSGRVAAFEVMLGTPAVQALIREGKTGHLQSQLETGSRDGMMTMEKALQILYGAGQISLREMNALTREFKPVKEFL